MYLIVAVLGLYFLPGAERSWWILALGFAFTMLLAALSWFVVEKPALRLKGRLLNR